MKGSVIKKIPAVFFIIISLFCSNILAGEIRVVSLAPSMTEILFAIGLTDKEIVGITDYCDYPKETKNILKVGTLMTASIEKIISLNPDYVFVVGNENSPSNSRLKGAGLRLIVLDPQNIEETMDCILKIGSTLNRDKQAESAVGAMKTRLAEIEAKAVSIKNKKKIYFEVWDDPITSCGRGSLVDEVITKAGGINIAGDIDIAYPMISPEVVIKEDPDFIILGYMSRNQKNAADSVIGRFGWQDIKAIKNKNVVCDIDPNIFLRPGPRIVDGIEEIYKRLYGDN